MSASDASPNPPLSAPRPAPIGSIVLCVVGVVLLLITLVAGGIGAALTWAHATQRDSDGFFDSGEIRIETLTHAIVSEDIDLGAGGPGPERRFDLGDLATVRLTVNSAAETPVFLGIGPEREVERYLDGVPHARLTDVDPVSLDFEDTGGNPPAAPTEQDFWAASTSGRGIQSLDWEVESGRWTAVVMNATGAPGLAVEASAGIKLDWLLPLGIGLLVVAALFGTTGSVALVVGAVRLGHHETTLPEGRAGPPETGSPVRLEGRLDEPLSRGLWLVKWILAIPHFLVLAVLWIAFGVLTVIAGVSILFTTRYPRSLFDFNVGVLRWTWRVLFYSYGGLATDRYPPFSLRDDPEYPARLVVEPPGPMSRGLVLVKWWLLAIPHYVVVAILTSGIAFGRDDGAAGPGLITWIVLVAAVVILFRGRYPRGIFDLVMGLQRWVFRVGVYAALMTDQYPPFRLDQGPDEPQPEAPRPEAPA